MHSDICEVGLLLCVIFSGTQTTPVIINYIISMTLASGHTAFNVECSRSSGSPPASTVLGDLTVVLCRLIPEPLDRLLRKLNFCNPLRYKIRTLSLYSPPPPDIAASLGLLPQLEY